MNNKKLFNYIDHYGGNSNSIKINNLDNMLDFESSDVIDNTEDYTSSLLDKILSNDSTNNTIHGGTLKISSLIKTVKSVGENVSKGVEIVDTINKVANGNKERCKCCINNDAIIEEIDNIIKELKELKELKGLLKN